MSKFLFIFLLIGVTITHQSTAQENTNEELKIYLDCNVCDNTFIKQNLGNVQFVRDQGQGDVHLFLLTQNNGSGGRLYEIDFIGINTF